MLRHLNPPAHADLIVGPDTSDDAVVWRRPDGRALVSTADFFTPMVDDPADWGRIAAANAASDVYAMGGRPLFALALAAWPRDALSLDLLGEVLAAGAAHAEAGGWVVAGGHTVDGPEPMYGQAVTGEVDADSVITNVGARPGDALVLTKALGTGVIATAVKRSPASDVDPGGPLHAAHRVAVESMTRLNDDAAKAMRAAGATAGTDVTGFGLLGHLLEMLGRSGLSATLDVDAVPVLSGTLELIADGHVPGGTARNLEHVAPDLDRRGADDAHVILLADAQTSGGLLFACSPSAADDAVAALVSTGHAAAVVGEVSAAGDDPRIRLR